MSKKIVMQKIIKILVNLGLVLVSGFLTYKLAYLIGEKYFFDRLFYQKSINHGYYWGVENDLEWEDFGERSEDLVKLITDNKIQKKDPSAQVLGAKNDDIYTVAVIGDSYVWGTGLKNRDRFVNILEEKLNKLFPTKVLSLAGPGNDIVDNYIKYKITKRLGYNVDLYIFGLVDNDILFDEVERLDQSIFDSIVNGCKIKPLRFCKVDINLEYQEFQIQYDNQVEESFDNEKYGNICVLKKVAGLLPKEKAIYFDFINALPGDHIRMERYIEILRGKGLTVMSYDYENCDGICRISEKEPHPSDAENRKFAQLLFDEITTNLQLGFVEKIKETK